MPLVIASMASLQRSLTPPEMSAFVWFPFFGALSSRVLAISVASYVFFAVSRWFHRKNGNLLTTFRQLSRNFCYALAPRAANPSGRKRRVPAANLNTPRIVAAQILTLFFYGIICSVSFHFVVPFRFSPRA
jgi:hypothetical protein